MKHKVLSCPPSVFPSPRCNNCCVRLQATPGSVIPSIHGPPSCSCPTEIRNSGAVPNGNCFSATPLSPEIQDVSWIICVSSCFPTDFWIKCHIVFLTAHAGNLAGKPSVHTGLKGNLYFQIFLRSGCTLRIFMNIHQLKTTTSHSEKT